MTEVLEAETESVTPRYKPAPRKPSDYLYERIYLARKLTPGHIPTLDDLMKHAERFGTDAVVETAAELGYGLDACVRLTDFCDRMDALAWKERHRFGSPPKQKSSEERCKLLLGIEDEDDD